MSDQEIIYQKIIRLYPLFIFSFFMVLITSFTLYYIFYPVFLGTPKKIYISPGTKINEIAWLLEKEGIIRSSFYFKFFVVLKGSKLKAGFYEFYGFLNLFDVIKILEKGGQGIKIVIPEGATIKEIEEIFKQNGFNVSFSNLTLKDYGTPLLLKYFSTTSSLEGFFMPDTYEFYKEEKEKEILRKVFSNFEKKLLPELLKANDVNPYEVLIFASIVEKEAKKTEDFPIIAGILIKRYKNNIKLQADATLVYEKCGFKFCENNLTKEDLNRDSPFNTYKRLGLPPRPISNPGVFAVRAVVNPKDTDYWFYLTDKEGKAYYAKTYKEHLENIKNYLKK